MKRNISPKPKEGDEVIVSPIMRGANTKDLILVQLEIFNYKTEKEIYFVQELLIPYLTSVYVSLIER